MAVISRSRESVCYSDHNALKLERASQQISEQLENNKTRISRLKDFMKTCGKMSDIRRLSSSNMDVVLICSQHSKCHDNVSIILQSDV